jgi:hypothetical protein
MSIARATGERAQIARSSFDELEELHDAYVQSVPIREKYFGILRMRLQWRLHWHQIATIVGLHRSHCWRVFTRCRADLRKIGENSRASVARIHVPDEDDDDQ